MKDPWETAVSETAISIETGAAAAISESMASSIISQCDAKALPHPAGRIRRLARNAAKRRFTDGPITRDMMPD
jgi:hypothetical protein